MVVEVEKILYPIGPRLKVSTYVGTFFCFNPQLITNLIRLFIDMKKLTLLLTLLVSCFTSMAQYPIIEEFDSFNGAGEWTVDNGGGVQNYGGAENYGTFNLGTTPYLNNTTHTIQSPTYDFTDCGTDITVSFPMSGYVEPGADIMNFQYYDGGTWNTDLTVTGLVTGTHTTTVPNTTTQFRFQLITDGPNLVYFRSNLTTYQLTPNATYNIPVDLSTQYIGGAPKTIQTYYYDIVRFTINCSSVLPIELISFNCEWNSNNVDLTWVSASEINNSHYLIEYSSDGYMWETIHKIDGAGNSTQIIEYKATHYSPPYGDNYYRLTQVDYDGNTETFNTVSCRKYNDKRLIEEVKYYNTIGQEVDEFTLGLVIIVTKYKNGNINVEKKHRTVVSNN